MTEAAWTVVATLLAGGASLIYVWAPSWARWIPALFPRYRRTKWEFVLGGIGFVCYWLLLLLWSEGLIEKVFSYPQDHPLIVAANILVAFVLLGSLPAVANYVIEIARLHRPH